MAIAPLMEYELDGGDCCLLEHPGPSVVLRVVERRDVARRRPASRVARKRRRLAVAGTVAGLMTVLALPLSAIGGAAPAPKAATSSAPAAGTTVYVVQPGDTLYSIAERFDRAGDLRTFARRLARETGSATVVPGERVAIP